MWIKQIRTYIVVVILVSIWLYFIFSKDDTAVKKSDKDIYVEKRTEIGQYKYEETQAEKKRAEAKAKKDALLQEMDKTETPKEGLTQ